MLISGITLPVDRPTDLKQAICKKCGRRPTDYRIIKQSIDARKGRVQFVLSVEAVFDDQPLPKVKRLDIPRVSSEIRPVVVGFGPAGMFASYILAKSGLRPIVLERGKCIEKRDEDVQNFWQAGMLRTSSNVQFGEGGAGTFSDGKLTTQIHNPLCKEVLEIFVEHGAPKDILYLAKPHIGTDILKTVVKNLRQSIINLGGEIHFETQMTDFAVQSGQIVSVTADKIYPTKHVVLAIGHSARDTFEYLWKQNLDILPKPFSVGARIEHPQEVINQSQYGKFAEYLGAADYKLAYHTEDGRGVYTFCMCPGGVVVGATSEENSVVTNGMSYHARTGRNANSAVLVSVTPEDYGKEHPLSGMYFQQELEQKAFSLGGGNYFAPAQRVEDFIKGQKTTAFGAVVPSYLPGVTPENLWNLLPPFVCEAMRQALPVFGRKLKGFDMPDAILTGVESRSSSPIRMVRNEEFQSNIAGLYPAGEGAGYAGGIMSSAVDGIKIALQIIKEQQ